MENMDPGHGNEKDRNTKKRSSFAFLLLIGIAVFYFVAQSIFSFWISGPGGGFLSASQGEEQPREEAPRTQNEEETKAQENLDENVKLEERLLARQLLLLGTNDNEVDVSVDISVVFYNEAGKMMTAEKVAEYLAKGLIRRKSHMILTPIGKLTVFMHNLWPSLTDKLEFSYMAKEPDSPFHK